MKIASCFLAIVLISSGLASAKLERAVFEGHLNDQYFLIEFKFAPMPAFPHYPDAPKCWMVLSELDVQIGKQSIKVPKSAYKDLFAPHTPGAPFYDPYGNIRLPLAGGDGEKSYTVEFIFKNGRLIARNYYPYLGKKPITTHYE